MYRCLKELLDGGAELTKVDIDNNNVLHIACIHGQLEVVQFLLQGKLSPELRYEASHWYCGISTYIDDTQQ